MCPLVRLGRALRVASTYDTTHNGRHPKAISRTASLHEFEEFHDPSEDYNAQQCTTPNYEFDDQSTTSDYEFDIDTDIWDSNMARSRSSITHKLKCRETYRQDRKRRPSVHGDLYKYITSKQNAMWESWKQRLREETDGVKSSVPKEKSTIQAHEISDEDSTDGTATIIDMDAEDHEMMSCLDDNREELSSSDWPHTARETMIPGLVYNDDLVVYDHTLRGYVQSQLHHAYIMQETTDSEHSIEKRVDDQMVTSATLQTDPDPGERPTRIISADSNGRLPAQNLYLLSPDKRQMLEPDRNR